MAAGTTIRVNVDGLQRFGALVLATSGPFRDCYRLWGRSYLAFLSTRYNAKARSEWPRLAPATTRRRKSPAARNKGRARNATPLIDQGHLRGALHKDRMGNVFADLRDGVRVGFDKQIKHPRARGAKATFGNIAIWHHFGMGHNPERPIFEPPDSATHAELKQMLVSAVEAAGRSAGTR